ncbi:MAG: sigma-70 family RNA polymerase sigma factor [Planctomycetota bacterium]
MTPSFYRLSSDARLVRRALRDDARAFETLVFRYQKPATGIARACGVTADAARDVVQEAFLKAFENLGQLRSPENFRSWFLTIVRNAARSNYRACLPEARVSLDASEPPVDSSSSHAAEQAELRDDLWQTVSGLPEPIREAVVLFYYEGESARAVAKTLGISKSNVLKRLERGRALLRETLWKRMETTLKDLLPSTREWTRQGRQLTLLLVGFTATAWGVPTAAAAAGGIAATAATTAAVEGGATVTRASLIYGGAWMSGKQVAIAAVAAASLLVGIFSFVTSDPGPSGGGSENLSQVEEPGGEELGGEALVAENTAKSGDAELRVEAEEVEVDPQAAVVPSIVGLVKSESGDLLVGAKLYAIHVESWIAVDSAGLAIEDPVDRRGHYQRAESHLPHTTADEEGEFRFTRLAPGEYRLVVGFAGHLPRVDVHTDVVNTGVEPEKLVIELRKSLRIAGRVEDPQGKPVSEASVRCFDSDLRRDVRDSDTPGLVEAWSSGEYLVAPEVVKTDSNGKFELDRVSWLRAEVVVDPAAAYPSLRVSDVEAGTDDLVIRLERGGSVSGRVVDESMNPIAERIGLSLLPLEREKQESPAVGEWEIEVVPDDPEWIPRVFSAESDEDGVFEFRGLPKHVKTYELLLASETRGEIRRRVDVREEVVDLGDIVCPLAKTISGYVRDRRDAPVVGATVFVARNPPDGIAVWGGRRKLPDRYDTATTDAAGHFVLRRLSNGSYSVRAYAEELASVTRDQVQAGEDQLIIVLDDGVWMTTSGSASIWKYSTKRPRLASST